MFIKPNKLTLKGIFIMICIATVHYKSDDWIDIQLKYIKKYVKEPFRIYACLNGIDKSHFGNYFFNIRRIDLCSAGGTGQAYKGTRLVDDIDCFVRQITVIQIFCGKLGGGL